MSKEAMCGPHVVFLCFQELVSIINDGQTSIQNPCSVRKQIPHATTWIFSSVHQRQFMCTDRHGDGAPPLLVRNNPFSSTSHVIMRLFYTTLFLYYVMYSHVQTACSFSLERKSRGKIKTTATQERSVGEAIQYADTADELLDIASTMWLPMDEDLPSHLQTQKVHHERRQRWSSQLLFQLGETRDDVAVVFDYWNDNRLARAVLAVALPFFDHEDRPNKEGRYLLQALTGMHALAGKSTPVPAETGSNTTTIHPDISHGLRIMMERVERMSHRLSLQQAVEMRWAARGLLARLGPLQILATSDCRDGHSSELVPTLTRALPNLEKRVASLPFDIIPQAVQWDHVFEMPPTTDIAEALRDSIPFQVDTIVTRSGSNVLERRGTAWVAEDGIGALAYSGKLMSPRALPTVVRNAMRLVERRVLDDEGIDPEPFFDCALCNHYPDADAACKFHTDPEHGTIWERLTCVVAAGDARRFAFRPIPGISTWSEWDTVVGGTTNPEETLPAVIYLFPGDVVKMWGSCNDNFHHAVYPSQDNKDTAGDRVSLVFKRAIRRAGGKRGHGLQGEGRRSRRRQRRDDSNDVHIPLSQQSSTKQRRQRN